MPGAASGTKWLGTTMPPLPYEQPSRSAPWRSTTRDAPAAARAVERGAQPDHAAADDHDVSRHQRMPQQNGSRSSRSSVLSAVT